MRLSSKEQIWFFGVLASFLGLPIGLIVADQNILNFKIYGPVLPSITFIAVSICLTSLIECFYLAMDARKADLSESEKSKIVMHMIVMTLMMIGYFTTFVVNIKKASSAGYLTDGFEVFLNVAMIVAAGFLHIRLTRILEVR